MSEKKLNNNKFVVIQETFEPGSEAIEAPLESLDMQTLLMVADKYKDKELLDELARRGLDFEKAFNDAVAKTNKAFFESLNEEKDA